LHTAQAERPLLAPAILNPWTPGKRTLPRSPRTAFFSSCLAPDPTIQTRCSQK
jgi:hypothetical protein